MVTFVLERVMCSAVEVSYSPDRSRSVNMSSASGEGAAISLILSAEELTAIFAVEVPIVLFSAVSVEEVAAPQPAITSAAVRDKDNTFIGIKCLKLI